MILRRQKPADAGAIRDLFATPHEWFTQFGFGSGDDYSITPSVGGWKPYFQIRPLTAFDDSLHGTFVFPDAFGS